MPKPSALRVLWLGVPVALLLIMQLRGTKPRAGEPTPPGRQPEQVGQMGFDAHPPATAPDPRFRVLTREVLASTPDDRLEEAILDHVSLAVGDDFDSQTRIVRAMPPGVRAVYATWWLDAEVNNGGFNQYFWNSTGELSDEALAGLRLIGAGERATLLEEAIRINQQERPRLDKLKEQGSLEAFSESYKDNRLNALDDRFFKLSEDSSQLRIAYIRRHPEQFLSTR